MADGADQKSAGLNNRIKYALLHPRWIFSQDTLDALRAGGTPVLVSEYQPEMKGILFCPGCGCPLFRSPEDKDNDRGGRNAYFGHKRGITTDCGLRTSKPTGKKYSTFEEATQAIQNGQLVVVSGFLQDRPRPPEKEEKDFDQRPVEDLDGEPATVPISRHTGKSFTLPSKITTVRGLCRNFDSNLAKYYYLPSAQHAHLLIDALHEARSISETTNSPILVYGEIIGFWDGGNGNPWNVRTIHLRYPSNSEYKNFSIKTSVAIATDHGIDKSAKGRILIAYGRVREIGIGLALSDKKWGELALLPTKYEKLLS